MAAAMCPEVANDCSHAVGEIADLTPALMPKKNTDRPQSLAIRSKFSRRFTLQTWTDRRFPIEVELAGCATEMDLARSETPRIQRECWRDGNGWRFTRNGNVESYTVPLADARETNDGAVAREWPFADTGMKSTLGHCLRSSCRAL
jgi:hypothetical protein